MSIVRCMKCKRILVTRKVVFDKEIYVCGDCKRQNGLKEKNSEIKK